MVKLERSPLWNKSCISPGEKRLQEVQVELERSHSRLSQIKAFLEYIKNQKSNPKGELRCGKDRRNSGRLRAIAASISRN
ncbi:hypothetical protein [Planktothricoides raciborskii]|uniref:Transposase n=2 Tax=Planktothricoides raciborskii TaxID=132608 RepID=A0AAU8JB95_9CYAN|nr:hypothetical protein [Planktothricoides raciborskii]MBD2545820.1 hypothetical protein [Planktothricoides raciborskii FACHB-1370]MBD2583960.1 hypothetical protein [Planktothricoides raciborskii FACHB-1261]